MKYPETKKVLNQLVADLSQFSAIIHQTHWYMKGRGFLFLHPKMDEFMEEINDQLDEVAERLVTLDGYPYSTLEEFAEHSGLKSEKGDYAPDMETRLKHLVKGFRYLVGIYQQGIEVSDKESDHVSQDIFISAKGALEKNIWMLQAELSKTPGNDL